MSTGKYLGDTFNFSSSRVIIKSKKGYFFVVDVFISLIILIVGILLVISGFISESQKSQTRFSSQGLANFMGGTSIAYYDSNFKATTLMNYDNALYGMTDYDFIIEYTNTLFEQIGEFYYRQNSLTCGDYDSVTCVRGIPAGLDLAGMLAEDIVNGSVPLQLEVQVVLRDFSAGSTDAETILYQRNPTPIFSKEESSLLIPSRILVAGIFDDTKSSEFYLWGPYMIEVHVWQ